VLALRSGACGRGRVLSVAKLSAGNIELAPIGARFCGPPGSVNGGYFAGLVSASCACTVRVRLQNPPPLATAFSLRIAEDHAVVDNAGVSVATAHPISLELTAPEPPRYDQALFASTHYAGFQRHEFPNCFVCGPARGRGDGLRIFPGPWRTGAVAAPWVPDASLAAADGKVRAEFMSAALDCPGYFASGVPGRMLLGEITVHIDRRVHAEEPCVVVGWHIGASGRKHTVGTALYDEDGQVCAKALGTWIELRPA